MRKIHYNGASGFSNFYVIFELFIFRNANANSKFHSVETTTATEKIAVLI
jgi:hypothetical protein